MKTATLLKAQQLLADCAADRKQRRQVLFASFWLLLLLLAPLGFAMSVSTPATMIFHPISTVTATLQESSSLQTETTDHFEAELGAVASFNGSQLLIRLQKQLNDYQTPLQKWCALFSKLALTLLLLSGILTAAGTCCGALPPLAFRYQTCLKKALPLRAGPAAA